LGSLGGVKPLLDTHIFLWGLLEPDRLHDEVVAAQACDLLAA